jgi:branched-chain amino acid transport system permease protein
MNAAIAINLLASGLAAGAIYALVAIGVVLVYRTTAVLNFAQGELLMLGAYSFAMTSALTNNPAWQMLAAIAAGVGGGLACFIVTHICLGRRSELAKVVGTLAIGTVAQSLMRIRFTDVAKTAPAWIFGDTDVKIAGGNVSCNSIAAMAVAVTLTVLLVQFLGRSALGRSVRSVAENHWFAALGGVKVRWTLALSWAAGGAFAAIGGVFLVPVTGSFPIMGAHILFPAVTAAFLGGLTSINGALAGGLLLGVAETFAVYLVGGAFQGIAIFALVLAILLIRPTGLFASLSVRKV